MLTNSGPFRSAARRADICWHVCLQFCKDWNQWEPRWAGMLFSTFFFLLFFIAEDVFFIFKTSCGYWDVWCDWQCFRSCFRSVCLWVNCLTSRQQIRWKHRYFLFFCRFLKRLFIFKYHAVLFCIDCEWQAQFLKGLQWGFVFNFHQASRWFYWAITNTSCLFLLALSLLLYILVHALASFT